VEVISVNGQQGIVKLNASDIPLLDANEVIDSSDMNSGLQEIAIKLGNKTELETIDNTNIVRAINEVRAVLPTEALSLSGKCDSTGTIITLTWQNASTPSYRGRELYVSTEDITAKDRKWCNENAILLDASIGSGRNNMDSWQYTGVLNTPYYFKLFTVYWINLKEVYGRGVALHIIAQPGNKDFDLTIIGDIKNLNPDIINAGAGDNLVNAINYVYENGSNSNFSQYEAENFKVTADTYGRQLLITWQNANYEEFLKSELYLSEEDIINANRDYCFANATKIYESNVVNYKENIAYNVSKNRLYYLKIFTVSFKNGVTQFSRGIGCSILTGNKNTSSDVVDIMIEKLKREVRIV
jgi:hypothetical protein